MSQLSRETMTTMVYSFKTFLTKHFVISKIAHVLQIQHALFKKKKKKNIDD